MQNRLSGIVKKTQNTGDRPRPYPAARKNGKDERLDASYHTSFGQPHRDACSQARRTGVIPLASEAWSAWCRPARSDVMQWVQTLYEFRSQTGLRMSMVTPACGGGDLTASQLSEQRPRRMRNRDTWRTTKELPDMTRRIVAKRTPNSLIWPWMVRYAGFRVTRYARGAGGITPFRAAHDRDYTQEIRLQRMSCSRSWHQNIVDCYREKDAIKEILRGTKGSA